MDTQVTTCEEGCGQIASLECTNCNAYFCEGCFFSSHFSNVMKRHIYGPIGKGSKKCSQHCDQRLDMYCITCEQIICIKCLFTRQHKSHDSVTIDEFAKTKTTDLLSLQSKLGDKLVKYTTISKEYELAKQSLKNVHHIINEDIKKSFDQIITLAKSRKDILLKESARVEREKLDDLERKWVLLSKTTNRLREACSTLASQIQESTGSSYQLVRIQKEPYIDLLQQVNKEALVPDLLNGVQSRLSLSVDSVLESLSTLGIIIIVTNETETVRRNKIASLVSIVFHASPDINHSIQCNDNVNDLTRMLHKKMTEKVVEPARYVFAWGGNFEAQLGMSSVTNYIEPMEVSFFTNKRIISIVAGLGHTVALTDDGVIYTFGQNSSGELGTGETGTQGRPQIVTGLTNRKIVKIAASHSCFHTLALAEDKAVYSWGKNTYGQLGLGDQRNRNVPFEVVSLADKNVVNIYAAGYSDDGFSLVLTGRGDVYAFGQNNYNQLGLGDTQMRLLPTYVSTLSNVVMLSTGGYHALALTADNRVFSWGHNSYGRLGHADLLDKMFPTEIVSLRDKNIVSIVAGGRFSFAITHESKIYAWGYNGQGELGLGDTTDRTSPQLITMMNKRVKSLKSGYEHTLCLTEDGCFYSFGNNKSGQLGMCDTVNRSAPHEIVKFRGFDIVDFACGNNFSFALIR